jgi:hypothetical protein
MSSPPTHPESVRLRDIEAAVMAGDIARALRRMDRPLAPAPTIADVRDLLSRAGSPAADHLPHAERCASCRRRLDGLKTKHTHRGGHCLCSTARCIDEMRAWFATQKQEQERAR